MSQFEGNQSESNATAGLRCFFCGGQPSSSNVHVFTKPSNGGF